MRIRPRKLGLSRVSSPSLTEIPLGALGELFVENVRCCKVVAGAEFNCRNNVAAEYNFHKEIAESAEHAEKY